jgi:hypothetical protein
MKNLNLVIEELKDLLNEKIKKYNLPVLSGNTIRIGKILVRENKNQDFVVIDTEKNISIAKTFSKIAAIATAKNCVDSYKINLIKTYDAQIEKHFNDLQFYNAVIGSTEDDARKEALEIRVEFSKSKIDAAKYALDRIILDDIR